MRKALSQLEHWVMDAVWSGEKATADEIRTRLARKKVLKDSTVRTVLRRLEDKGYVKHSVAGRSYLYSGTEQPQRIAAHAVRQLIDRFCNGSVEHLLIGMVDGEVIKPGELKRIAANIARRKRTEG